jgi:hypothetical protein
MMAISEEESAADNSRSTTLGDMPGIPGEFEELYKDEVLLQTLVDLIHTAADLDILDFEEFCKNIGTPKPMWVKTRATTGKHIPIY